MKDFVLLLSHLWFSYIVICICWLLEFLSSWSDLNCESSQLWPLIFPFKVGKFSYVESIFIHWMISINFKFCCFNFLAALLIASICKWYENSFWRILLQTLCCTFCCAMKYIFQTYASIDLLEVHFLSAIHPVWSILPAQWWFPMELATCFALLTCLSLMSHVSHSFWGLLV